MDEQNWTKQNCASAAAYAAGALYKNQVFDIKTLLGFQRML